MAFTAAAMEGRLLALRQLPEDEIPSPHQPDTTLADATGYSRAAVRKAIARTLAAIGLDTSSPSRATSARRDINDDDTVLRKRNERCQPGTRSRLPSCPR